MSYALDSTSVITYGDRTAFDGAAQLTISYWVYPAATASLTSTSYQVYLGRINKTGSNYYNGWSCGTGYGYPRMVGGAFANAQAYSYGYDYGFNVLTAGAWNHVLVVYDGTQATVANRVKVYVNRSAVAINVGTAIPATLGTVATTTDLFLRNDSDTVKLAEVGIWIGVVIGETAIINQLGAASNAVPPNEVGIAGLAHYLPLLADANDSVAGITATVTGAVLDAAHPPVVSQASRVVRRPGFVNTPRLSVARRTV